MSTLPSFSKVEVWEYRGVLTGALVDQKAAEAFKDTKPVKTTVQKRKSRNGITVILTRTPRSFKSFIRLSHTLLVLVVEVDVRARQPVRAADDENCYELQLVVACS